MTWPFDKDKPNPEAKDGDKPPEKSPAELIAESVAAALKPVTEGIAALTQEVDAIKQATKKPEPPPREPTEPTSVMDDENAAFAQRLTPILARQLELESRVVKSDIKHEYESAGFGDLWRQFEKDIDKQLDDTPLVSNGRPLRGDPAYIRNVVDMIFGRAARQAGMRFDGQNKRFFLESAGGDSGAHPPPEDDGLTPEQRKVFNRMNVPLDQAKKVLSKLKFVS